MQSTGSFKRKISLKSISITPVVRQITTTGCYAKFKIRQNGWITYPQSLKSPYGKTIKVSLTFWWLAKTNRFLPRISLILPRKWTHIRDANRHLPSLTSICWLGFLRKLAYFKALFIPGKVFNEVQAPFLSSSLVVQIHIEVFVCYSSRSALQWILHCAIK